MVLSSRVLAPRAFALREEGSWAGQRGWAVCRGGAQVKTLPFCRHSFHADCLLPWLRQQGRGAFCPLCKTPVFSQSAWRRRRPARRRRGRVFS